MGLAWPTYRPCVCVLLAACAARALPCCACYAVLRVLCRVRTAAQTLEEIEWHGMGGPTERTQLQKQCHFLVPVAFALCGLARGAFGIGGLLRGSEALNASSVSLF